MQVLLFFTSSFLLSNVLSWLPNLNVNQATSSKCLKRDTIWDENNWKFEGTQPGILKGTELEKKRKKNTPLKGKLWLFARRPRAFVARSVRRHYPYENFTLHFTCEKQMELEQFNMWHFLSTYEMELFSHVNFLIHMYVKLEVRVRNKPSPTLLIHLSRIWVRLIIFPNFQRQIVFTITGRVNAMKYTHTIWPHINNNLNWKLFYI